MIFNGAQTGKTNLTFERSVFADFIFAQPKHPNVLKSKPDRRMAVVISAVWTGPVCELYDTARSDGV